MVFHTVASTKVVATIGPLPRLFLYGSKKIQSAIATLNPHEGAFRLIAHALDATKHDRPGLVDF